MSDGGYPAGAQYDPVAPWNEPEPKKVKVLIRTVYCREAEIEVPDDYTSKDIIEAAQEQISTPVELLREITCDTIGSCMMEAEITSWDLEDYIVDIN